MILTIRRYTVYNKNGIKFFTDTNERTFNGKVEDVRKVLLDEAFIGMNKTVKRDDLVTDLCYRTQ